MNMTLGKAIDGVNVIKSLEDMPHLLIAGATGSGKSVGVNDFILSLMLLTSNFPGWPCFNNQIRFTMKYIIHRLFVRNSVDKTTG